MTGLVARLDQAWYPGVGDRWDAALFREMILAEIGPETRMLDLGAGRGAGAHMNFRGVAREVAGVDVDAAVLDNPALDRAVHAPDGSLSAFEDEAFDLVVSKDVLEHVVAPRALFAEVARVLRPGGLFLAKTPNRGHYVPLVARATPTAFHKAFNRMRGRAEIDTFPTVYRANTRRDLERLAAGAGLTLERLERRESRPEYLRFHPGAYLVGMVYERTVNRLGLDGLKAVIYARMRKGGRELCAG